MVSPKASKITRGSSLSEYSLITARFVSNTKKLPLGRNLRDIEIFTRERLKRSLVKKLIYRSRDRNDIARFRTLLRQSLDIFGVSRPLSFIFRCFALHTCTVDSNEHVNTAKYSTAHG